jgi:hypothetical protein
MRCDRQFRRRSSDQRPLLRIGRETFCGHALIFGFAMAASEEIGQ